MAIFHLHVKSVSRGQGKSVVAKAAYNAREKLRDERDGALKDYSRHNDEPVFSGIFAPKDAPEWAQDRERLWNAVEQVEKAKNAQLAIEITGALPHEFTDQQREWLIKDFVREEFTRKGMVVDLNIHPPPREPEREGDKPNHHFHALIALREIGPDGFGERVLNTQDWELEKQRVEHWREKWEYLVNRHLERHGFEQQIDRRTLEAQGIDREPTQHRGPTVDAMERRGLEPERGRTGPEAPEIQATVELPPPIKDRVAEWWQRIEQAIDKGGGYEQARERGWLNQPYGPDELQQLREFRSEILGMRQQLNIELADRELAPEYRAALRAAAGELRDLHHDTSKHIAMLALKQSAYEPKVIEMGRSRLNEFEHMFDRAAGSVSDIAAGFADMAGKAVEALVDFFMTPSLPTPELMAARREARETKIERAEYETRRGNEDDIQRARTHEQEQAKREQEARKFHEQQRHDRGLDGRERWERER
ncbi:MAG: MobA/MobL family protein [Acidobacteriaceae bacterium]|nr:MobA/MobL family protein [Acidobacteriaceae bacterium]